ncbi:EcoEI R domain protein [Catenovulum agarivorans DS-2]|uniref:EcoEI R domain protein n=2 Tax=Catenovulum agarivorans TaxID=1172192 RepID=W7QRS4_9ALTE|nr:EcoEI R domain protein [Catenovulum agarivorans DS-2]
MRISDMMRETVSTELSRERLTALIELSGLGTVKDTSTAFGGKPVQLLAAFKQLQQQLYY